MSDTNSQVSPPNGTPYFKVVRADSIDPATGLGSGTSVISVESLVQLILNAGGPNGVVVLGDTGQLLIGTASVLSVESGGSDAQQFVKILLPLDPTTPVGGDGTVLGDLISGEKRIPSGSYFLGAEDILLRVRGTGELPSDVTLNGGVYIAGATALPAGLSADPATGVILTDGTTYYPNTINNVGVLCAASE